jgi:hypothetical protein
MLASNELSTPTSTTTYTLAHNHLPLAHTARCSQTIRVRILTVRRLRFPIVRRICTNISAFCAGQLQEITHPPFAHGTPNSTLALLVNWSACSSRGYLSPGKSIGATPYHNNDSPAVTSSVALSATGRRPLSPPPNPLPNVPDPSWQRPSIDIQCRQNTLQRMQPTSSPLPTPRIPLPLSPIPPTRPMYHGLQATRTFRSSAIHFLRVVAYRASMAFPWTTR